MLLISYKLRLSYMGSDVGQILLTVGHHRDHLILYALVCEKKLAHMGKSSENSDLVCEKKLSIIHRWLSY